MRLTASYVHRVFSNYQTTRPCASGAFGSCDARGKTARVVNPPTRHHPRVGALSARRCVRDRVRTVDAARPAHRPVGCAAAGRRGPGRRRVPATPRVPRMVTIYGGGGPPPATTSIVRICALGVVLIW